MKHIIVVFLAIGSAGCDNLRGILGQLSIGPSTITLELVNETDLPVDPAVFVSDLSDVIIEGLTDFVLTLDGNEQNFGDLVPGETVTRVYDCDDFKAVQASDAELITGIGISPDDDSALFVDEEDFRCGDTLRITYSGSITNFDARIRVISQF